jgi:hypothetical protein
MRSYPREPSKGTLFPKMLEGVDIQPNRPKWRIMIRPENSADYEEFARSCKTVPATAVEDSEVGIMIYTDSVSMCTVVLGFGHSQGETTVSIKANADRAVRSDDGWRCTTVREREGHGNDLSADHAHQAARSSLSIDKGGSLITPRPSGLQRRTIACDSVVPCCQSRRDKVNC